MSRRSKALSALRAPQPKAEAEQRPPAKVDGQDAQSERVGGTSDSNAGGRA